MWVAVAGDPAKFGVVSATAVGLTAAGYCIGKERESPPSRASSWLPPPAAAVASGTSNKYSPVSQALAPAFEVRMPARGEWTTRHPLPVLLTCEHAGSELPPGYTWGEDKWLRGTHWAVDIGIRQFCLDLHARLHVPAVLAAYSRLFCDCNRPPPVRAASPDTSESTGGQGGASAEYLSTPFLTSAEGGRAVVLNQALSEPEIEYRLATVWRPYHNAVAALVDKSPLSTLILSVHSYTRQFEQNLPREVEVGILCYPERDLGAGKPATKLLELLLAAGIDARINEPYSLVLDDGSLYRTHAPELESGGRANLTVELRQDKLEEDAHWREIVLRCVVACVQ